MKLNTISILMQTILFLGFNGLLGMVSTNTDVLEGKKFYQADFALLGVEYCSTVDFSAIRSNYNFCPDNVEDTPEQDRLNNCYGPLVRAGYCAPISIKFINSTVNYGVFADCDLVPGQMIAEYTGKVVKYKHLLPGAGKDYAWNYVDNRFALDGYQSGNFTRFVNHSYRPNVTWEFIWVDGYWHLVYIVAKPIKKDEQLFINYGWKYWSARGIDPVELNN